MCVCVCVCVCECVCVCVCECVCVSGCGRGAELSLYSGRAAKRRRKESCQGELGSWKQSCLLSDDNPDTNTGHERCQDSKHFQLRMNYTMANSVMKRDNQMLVTMDEHTHTHTRPHTHTHTLARRTKQGDSKMTYYWLNCPGLSMGGLNWLPCKNTAFLCYNMESGGGAG